MTYFVICQDDDGEVFVDKLTKEQLLEHLNEYYWGDSEIFSDLPDFDLAAWHSGLLIIKGEIVVPRAVEKITSFEVD